MAGNPFSGLLTGEATPSPALSPAPLAPTPTGNAFQGILTGKSPAVAPITPVAPASASAAPVGPSPTPTPSQGGIPASALKGPLGGGYGASDITDPASGKPLLTYENQNAKASQLLSDRTAPTFDPTVPQKVDPKVLQDPRMAESVSQAIKSAVGGNAYSELDHIMPLELGGSNNKTNLRLEPGSNPSQKYSSSNPTLTDPIENQIADQVHSGQISLVDGWKAMAKAKGITLPEEGGQVPNLGQKGIQPNTEPNEQPKDIPGMVALKAFPALTSSLADLQTNPLSLGSSLKEIVSTPFNDIQKAGQAVGSAIASFINGLKTNAPASQKISEALQTVGTGAGLALSPITALFDTAAKVPIVGSIVKLAVNVPFSVAGDVGGDIGMGLIHALPISDQAKQNLEPGIRAIYSLAAQIGVGAHIAPDVLGTLADKFGAKDATTIVNKAHEVAQEAKNTTSEPAKPTEPPAAPTPKEAPVSETPATQKEPTPEVTPIEGTGETKTSGLAQGVEAKAVEEKLTRGFGDLPEYKTVSMKDQAAKAVDLVTNNYDQAKRVAMGQEKPPEGVLPESVFVAIENKALKDGDVNTLRDLATQSSLTSEATTMGQRIRTLAERDPESPVGAIKDLQSAREKAATAKLGKGKTLEGAKGDIANDIKSEIKKTTPTKQSWTDFVNTIKC